MDLLITVVKGADVLLPFKQENTSMTFIICTRIAIIRLQILELKGHTATLYTRCFAGRWISLLVLSNQNEFQRVAMSLL